MLSDEQWIDALSGRSRAHEEAAVRHLHALLRGSLAKGFGRQFSDEDLDDLTQASVTRVIEKLATFEGRSKLSTWAVSLAVNLALGELRKRKYQAVSWEQLQESCDFSYPKGVAYDGPGERLAQSSRDKVLADAIDAALSERQREALAAKLTGMELMEIARRMGSSRAALYKLLFDARRRLLEHLTEQGWEARDLLLSEGETHITTEVLR